MRRQPPTILSAERVAVRREGKKLPAMDRLSPSPAPPSMALEGVTTETQAKLASCRYHDYGEN
jgi:hypothetical protein